MCKISFKIFAFIFYVILVFYTLMINSEYINGDKLQSVNSLLSDDGNKMNSGGNNNGGDRDGGNIGSIGNNNNNNNGGGGSKRNLRSVYGFGRPPKMLQISRSKIPIELDLLVNNNDDTFEKTKRYDDYGHLRFGKRAGEDQFDDYGHMRFGRGSVF